jgi:hypothetical protein
MHIRLASVCVAILSFGLIWIFAYLTPHEPAYRTSILTSHSDKRWLPEEGWAAVLSQLTPPIHLTLNLNHSSLNTLLPRLLLITYYSLNKAKCHSQVHSQAPSS